MIICRINLFDAEQTIMYRNNDSDSWKNTKCSMDNLLTTLENLCPKTGDAHYCFYGDRIYTQSLAEELYKNLIVDFDNKDRIYIEVM